MTNPETEQQVPAYLDPNPWRDFPRSSAYYEAVRLRPSARSFVLAIGLFVLTLVTSLLAGTHFATAYAHNQAASFDALLQTFQLLYRNPAILLTGLPFALTLLTILLVHELGHYYACQYHHIHASFEAERDGPVQDRRELDLLVAPDARVGGPAGRVLGYEVPDDVGVEPFGHVPDVERDADHVGGAAGVPRVLQRAAARAPVR